MQKLGARHHLLLTKAARGTLPNLYATENIPTDEKIVRVKFFSPYSGWTWYAVEFDARTGTFFGFVDGDVGEWGYFTLAELENAYRGSLPLVERDCYFRPTRFAEIATRFGR